MSTTISVGNRVKVGRNYGTARLITLLGIWFHRDDGVYSYGPLGDVERVHGNKARK